jgi:hypothetical protein
LMKSCAMRTSAGSILARDFVFLDARLGVA